MAVMELTSERFRGFVKDDYAIVDCYGDFCAACVMLEPVFDAVAATLSGISFGKINLTHHEQIAQEFKIDAMPTILFFRNGQLQNQFVGCLDRETLLELIAQLLYR